MGEYPGRFIVLDGVDGCGKTTQAARLAKHLKTLGRPVLHLRDPGGTKVGESVRATLLDPATGAISIRTETLLYMACRAQLVEERILPALQEGTDVVCERYLLSTLIYQGSALDPSHVAPIAAMGAYATQDLIPDMTLILDLPVELAKERMGKNLDRIESRPMNYHEKVREGFARAEELVSWPLKRIPADGTQDEVFKALKTALFHVF